MEEAVQDEAVGPLVEAPGQGSAGPGHGAFVPPTSDEIALAVPMSVTLMGSVYDIPPPSVREVRAFNRVRLPLDFNLATAMRAFQANPNDGALLVALKDAEAALVDAVLCSVPEIAAVYDNLLSLQNETLREDLNDAFRKICWWYQDPLERGLAAQGRARLQAKATRAMETAMDSRTASSLT